MATPAQGYFGFFPYVVSCLPVFEIINFFNYSLYPDSAQVVKNTLLFVFCTLIPIEKFKYIHYFPVYDSVIPRGIGVQLPFLSFRSARINCLLTSGW